MRLLLVEDERRLSDALVFILKKNKYLVDVAYDGETAQDMAESEIYDLIILDRMLPKKDGVSVLKYLRKIGINTAVLFLTAKDTIEDRVTGLDAGADDYLVKPFANEELLARVRALCRRKSEVIVSEKLSIGKLDLDPLSCELSTDNETIKLTLKESQLLELLIRNSGQVITKEQILNRIWGFDSEADFNNVELYIHYLRKKLDSKLTGIKISTVRGIGYSLEVI